MIVTSEIENFRHIPTVQAYKYFWIKYCVDVDIEQHCQNCLIGAVSRKLGSRHIGGAKEPVHRAGLILNEDSARLVYICGVAEPYNWEKNFHLAYRVVEGSRVVKRWPGIDIAIKNAEELTISDEFVDAGFRRNHEHAYRTCRNVHFAWAMRKGIYGSPLLGEHPRLF